MLNEMNFNKILNKFDGFQNDINIIKIKNYKWNKMINISLI